MRSVSWESVGAALVAAALLLLAPGPAAAGPLSAASLTITSPSFLPPLAFPGAGASGSAASPTSVSLAGGSAFNGTATAFVAGTIPATTLQLVLSGNGAGSFSGTPLVGTATFAGLLQLQAFGGLTITTVPVAIGQPGTTTRAFILPTGGLPAGIRLQFNGWTAGTATVVTTGGVHTAMGANALSPGGVGSLSLVSPIAIDSFFTLPGPVPNGVAFANLQLVFVPEPGTLLLTLWGATCLGLVGRRRQRRR